VRERITLPTSWSCPWRRRRNLVKPPWFKSRCTQPPADVERHGILPG